MAVGRIVSVDAYLKRSTQSLVRMVEVDFLSGIYTAGHFVTVSATGCTAATELRLDQHKEKTMVGAILANALHSAMFDQIFVWVGFLIVVAVTIRVRRKGVHASLEEFLCESVAFSLLITNLLALVIFLLGKIFLIQFEIKTPLWLIWQPAFQASRVFIHGAALAGIFLVATWTIVGRIRGSHSIRVSIVTGIAAFLFAVNCWLVGRM